MSALRNRARGVDLRWVDAIFAATLTIDLILEASLAHGLPASDRLVTVVVAVPFSATIAVRRRWPAGALVGGMAITLAQALAGGQLFSLPSQTAEFVPILCSYGAGAWLELRRGIAALAAAACLLYAMTLVAAYIEHTSGAPGWSSGLGLLVFFLAAPWAIGRLVRERNRRTEAFAALETQAVAERAERERAAVAEERVVIGRELQDIIAHSVSMMVVQAGGARAMLHTSPDRARASLLTVEHTGREALAEMRRLLGLLRKEDDPRALTPQPGLDQLPELVASLRRRGLVCELHSEGESIELTPGIDLVGYRAVEAMLRGAASSGCAHASTTVRYGAARLELEVRGTGSLGSLDQELRAVSERVGLYGGRLEPIDGENGQSGVRCRLPLEGALAT